MFFHCSTIWKMSELLPSPMQDTQARDPLLARQRRPSPPLWSLNLIWQDLILWVMCKQSLVHLVMLQTLRFINRAVFASSLKISAIAPAPTGNRHVSSCASSARDKNAPLKHVVLPVCLHLVHWLKFQSTFVRHCG